MPGITGIISKMSLKKNAKDLRLMIDAMMHEPFYTSGTYVNDQFGLYAGWVCHKGSFSDCMPVLNEKRDLIMLYSGENFATLGALIFLALVIVGTFFIRRGWCRFCPTGISISIVNKFKGLKWAPMLHLDKNETKCTKCGICKRVCPVQVTEVYEQKSGKVMTSMCMLCLRCVEMCPYEDCLRVKLSGKTVLKSRNWLEPAELD